MNASMRPITSTGKATSNALAARNKHLSRRKTLVRVKNNLLLRMNVFVTPSGKGKGTTHDNSKRSGPEGPQAKVRYGSLRAWE